ncbi:hypothetical protein HOA91_03695 [Candidatus Woesearchaeota archaeon]|jgi:hypothetical protein|nr:hypothetical protein [Candidatus Woesearchaeota archaeon]
MGSNIGAEIEYNLIDSEGYLVNNAPQILADSRNDGSFVKEGTNSQIEIVSDPADTVEELGQNIRGKIILLEDICKSYGSVPIPASEFGAGKGELRGMSDPLKNRGPIYLDLFGKESFEELRAYSGIHLHISQTPGKQTEQYNLLHALDLLSYALTSSSPISYQGINSINCHRVNSFRNNVFKDHPLQGQLQPYINSTNELDKRNQLMWQQWLNVLTKKNNVTAEGYVNLFKPENTGYAPIRKRDNIGPTGTFEVRSFDTNSLDITLAVFALYKGIHDKAMNNNCPIEIATPDNTYNFAEDKIILPNYQTLLQFENEGIQNGLKSDLVRDYIAHLLPYAEAGLPPEDKIYLAPLKKMLLTRDNPADEIMNFMREQGYAGHQFTPQQTAQTNLYMREKHLHSLN